jgi:hypothetical protein
MATFLVTILRFHSETSTPIIHPTANYSMMPFTAAQIVLFFKDQAYMALKQRTATALAAEGIPITNNISEFDKEGMNSIYCNLPKILYESDAGVHGELREIQTYKLSTNS